MKKIIAEDISRRELLKYSAITMALLSIPDFTGCSSTNQKKCPDINYDQETILKNATLIDVQKGKSVKNSLVKIKNGYITYAGQENPFIEIDDKAQIFDLKGKFLIPGLINGHLHLTLPAGSYLTTFDFPFIFSQFENNFTINIEKGITTVRDMGAMPNMIQNYIDDVENGSLIGPRVVHSNSFITVEGGYVEIDEEDLHPLGGLARAFFSWGKFVKRFSNMKELKKRANDNLKNATFLKLASWDDITLIAGKNEKIPVYSDEHLDYLFDFALRNNLGPCAHNTTIKGFRRALKYPFHALEHSISDDFLSDQEVQTFVDKKIMNIPTIILGNIYLYKEAFRELPKEYQTDFIKNEIDIREKYYNSITEKDVKPFIHNSNITALKWFKEANYNWEKLYQDKKYLIDPNPFLKMLIYGVKNLLKLKKAGAVLGLGTDSGVPWNYHGTLWREMEMWSRLGFTNKEILKAATVNNAKICRMEDKIGSIEAGKYADLVILDENPLKNIMTCRYPELVFKGGKLLFQSKDLVKSESGIKII